MTTAEVALPEFPVESFELAMIAVVTPPMVVITATTTVTTACVERLFLSDDWFSESLSAFTW
ncbi:hypothetical protein CF165_13545 [Amycolatopsis vastitatis]|uniref:Uncharacterized protein n=1 Tax=Amycolatopsis vastitatis TaxID=1905142 RepID=A0A229TBA2_9PSEU|nr:hypothetical protein CF165_13545 [Amycolatopsis vastitatis]